MEDESYDMVVAIDFGTTFSGYAYSFRRASDDIKINHNWGKSLGFQSNKTPTSVLINSVGDFVAFGYEAEQQFTAINNDHSDNSDISESGKLLFRHFKMVLHTEQKLSQQTVVYSTSGVPAPAIDIFAHALQYFKNHVIEVITNQQTSAPDPTRIRWVVTVPAIWMEISKQFMREAAVRSGLIRKKNSRQLIIALEPEAASFYCRQLGLAHASGEYMPFRSGTRYLVLDCGGGTNDMVAHEVIVDYKVRELFAVSGGSAGGICVDQNFVCLLRELLGNDFIDSYKTEFPQQWFSLVSAFEHKKQAVREDGSGLSIDIHLTMSEAYEVRFHKSIRNAIIDANKDGVTYNKGAVLLSQQVVQNLFRSVVEGIVEGVKAIRQEHCDSGFDYIMMVGGFSESSLLQSAVKQTFNESGCRVIIPSEAQLAIIRGAVLYGYRYDQIVSRFARNTYGCNIHVQFDPHIHDESHRILKEYGVAYCRDLFDPLVVMGQEIEIGSIKQIEYELTSKQPNLVVKLYSLPRQPHDVQYTDDRDMTMVGKVRINTNDTLDVANRKVLVRFTFGSTELLVEAIDQTTGHQVNTTVDFLSE